MNNRFYSLLGAAALLLAWIAAALALWSRARRQDQSDMAQP